MAELDIHGVMEELAERRPIFHSEANFQFAFAWQIATMKRDGEVRLEKPFRRDDKTRYLDIWLPTARIPIELKYCTRDLGVEHDGEAFALKNQSAHDLRRHDFIADLVRIEGLVSQDCASAQGYAIFLTNDPLYWKCGRPGTIDEAFRLHEGRILRGVPTWAKHAAKSTKQGRSDLLRLRGSYELHWKPYRSLTGEYGEFRYLAVRVE